jgi:peptidoglycan L-alanyl-D-glutamate endopeptidase CwlK
MYGFGKTSRSRLDTCHPDLILIAETAIQHVNFSIICGERDEEEQEKAFNEGNSKVHFPNSSHNKKPSMAFDAMPYFKEKPHIRWDEKAHCSYLAGILIMTAEMLYAQGKITHKLKWGADWDKDGYQNDHKFIDRPHYELLKV